LLISLATGGAVVFYFRDAPTLGVELLHGTAPGVAYVFLGLFTLTTYLLGGLAREQVCIYMGPWPRIQGAMVDHDSLLISYRDLRGEPRGAHKKGATWDDRGDCIDCASPFARWASTFATARSSNAFNARCASMPAMRSWIAWAVRVT
jgi:polyferredoxin